MQPLEPDSLTGPWVPMPLPPATHAEVNCRAIASGITALGRLGAAGVAVVSGLGELDEEQYAEVSECVAEAAEEADLPFALGVQHRHDGGSVQRASQARRVHPGALWIEPAADTPRQALLDGGAWAEVGQAAAPVGLVFDLRGLRELPQVHELAHMQAQVPGLLGVELDRADEDWLQEARPLQKTLALFVPGVELATGYRHGAAGSRSLVAALSPAGAARWFYELESDVRAALALELRIQRLFEQHVRDLELRAGFDWVDLQHVCCAAGGWWEASDAVQQHDTRALLEHAKNLRRAAREQLPASFTADAFD